jgi:hypothetical protein
MPPKKARFEKKSPENIIFHDLREGNPWSEDENGNAPYWRTHNFLMDHIKF